MDLGKHGLWTVIGFVIMGMVGSNSYTNYKTAKLIEENDKLRKQLEQQIEVKSIEIDSIKRLRQINDTTTYNMDADSIESILRERFGHIQ